MNPFCSGFLTVAKNCPDRVRVAPQTISANKKPLSSLEPLAKSATVRAGEKLCTLYSVLLYRIEIPGIYFRGQNIEQ
jgi:hypothetical protein